MSCNASWKERPEKAASPKWLAVPIIAARILVIASAVGTPCLVIDTTAASTSSISMPKDEAIGAA